MKIQKTAPTNSNPAAPTNSNPAAPKSQPSPAPAATAKPTKTALDRAFATAATAKRSIARLARITSGWRPEGPLSTAIAAFRKTVDDMSVDSGSAVEQIANLASAGYKAPSGRGGTGPRVPLKVGAQVRIKPMLVKNKYNFLDEAQRGALFVEREVVEKTDKGDQTTYLVVCRLPGLPAFPVGMLKPGALEGVGAA